MRVCVRANTIPIDIPNAYENNAGLRGILDLPMHAVRRRRRFCGLLE